jgi:hypothetical protein
MMKLKLIYDSWIKNFDCLFFKDNTVIELLLKNKKLTN